MRCGTSLGEGQCGQHDCFSSFNESVLVSGMCVVVGMIQLHPCASSGVSCPEQMLVLVRGRAVRNGLCCHLGDITLFQYFSV